MAEYQLTRLHQFFFLEEMGLFRQDRQDGFLQTDMKTFIHMQCVFSNEEFELEGVRYTPGEFYKLHGYKFNVHKYFDKNQEAVTLGCLNWEPESGVLFLKMWISPEETAFFEKDILSGSLVPVGVRFVPDSVDSESVKRTAEMDIEKIIERALNG